MSSVMGTKVIAGRQTAAAEGDLVVFHIGMRINRFRAVRHWLPVLRAMPRMIKELARDEGSGLLGYRLLSGGPRLFYVVQYWRSKEQLLAYASDAGRLHRPAWADFNRRARAGQGHVGIWHETFAVPAGGYEAIYADMPAFGLAAATGVVPVARRGERAAGRLRRSPA